MFHIFIMNLVEEPRYFFAWIISVIVGITVHELAHGWVALKHGDQTPIHTGHMTANPLVHMGPFSIVVLLLIGLAWGAMPIDSTRLRGKYAEARVALAGPASNLLMGLAAVIALGLWARVGYADQDNAAMMNLRYLIYIFGWANLTMFLFNMIPVPPLDGSHILANFSQGYARLLSDPAKQNGMRLLIIIPFVLAPVLFGWSMFVVLSVGSILAGRALGLPDVGLMVPEY